jgi:hypothetical protein
MSSPGPKEKTARKPLSTFLRALFLLISDPANAAIVSWTATGTTFVIKDINAFATHVLPRYYKVGALHARGDRDHVLDAVG